MAMSEEEFRQVPTLGMELVDELVPSPAVQTLERTIDMPKTVCEDVTKGVKLVTQDEIIELNRFVPRERVSDRNEEQTVDVSTQTQERCVEVVKTFPKTRLQQHTRVD